MSLNHLQFKFNTLQTQLFLLTKSLLNYVTLNTTQTITSKKVFVVPPQTFAPPTQPSELCNKEYIDSITSKAVFLDGNQTLGTGIKTFTNLPECSQLPLTSNQFVNKTYADSLVPTPINAVLINGDQTLGDGIKTFINLPQSTTIPLSPYDFVNKAYVDTQKAFQKSILNIPFSGNIETFIQLDSPVLGLCQISGRIELLPNQSMNIGDIFLKIKDDSIVLANSLSQVNSQGLISGELATAQILCMNTIVTNAKMTFTLNNIVGRNAPYGTYSLFLDIIKM